METCDDILGTKGNALYTIAADATVLEAVEAMCAMRVGALLVGDATSICGILSERDVMARVVLRRLAPESTRVADVMTRDVVFVEPHTTQREAMAMMTQRKCRHLPVVAADGVCVGLVSIGDLVRSASHEQELEVRFLAEYIRGAA